LNRRGLRMNDIGWIVYYTVLIGGEGDETDNVGSSFLCATAWHGVCQNQLLSSCFSGNFIGACWRDCEVLGTGAAAGDRGWVVTATATATATVVVVDGGYCAPRDSAPNSSNLRRRRCHLPPIRPIKSTRVADLAEWYLAKSRGQGQGGSVPLVRGTGYSAGGRGGQAMIHARDADGLWAVISDKGRTVRGPWKIVQA
jgi:hypothetical protein